MESWKTFLLQPLSKIGKICKKTNLFIRLRAIKYWFEGIKSISNHKVVQWIMQKRRTQTN